MLNIIKLLLMFSPFMAISQVREPWITKDKWNWPPIALTNNIQFKNGDRYIHSSFPYAGTGFLINNGTDTLAITAKHILLIARNRKTNSVSLNSELANWTMKPKGNSIDYAEIGKLINEDTSEIIEGPQSSIFERDMLVLAIKKITGNIFPLKVRYSPIRPGEKVYMPGCAYPDKVCTVNEGYVINKYGFDILIDLNSPVSPGTSGSPVIDANGYLIGVFSSMSHDNKLKKDVAVAISTEYLKDVLGKKLNLNQPKKDYGEMIVQITLHSGPEAAINEYKRLTSYPHMYYLYNFRSATHNGLREAGEKLLELDQTEEAIEILKFNCEINSAYFMNYNILAKAYLKAGNKQEAIKAYKASINTFNDPIVNDAFNELQKLERQ